MQPEVHRQQPGDDLTLDRKRLRAVVPKAAAKATQKAKKAGTASDGRKQNCGQKKRRRRESGEWDRKAANVNTEEDSFSQDSFSQFFWGPFYRAANQHVEHEESWACI